VRFEKRSNDLQQIGIVFDYQNRRLHQVKS
jgi:hypothetical protein